MAPRDEEPQADETVQIDKTRVSLLQQKGSDPSILASDCLVVIYSKEPAMLGKRFVLDKSPYAIGRGTGSDIVLTDDSVSRLHVRLEGHTGAWACVDGGSTNGTYVNDARVERADLRNGDRVKVGGTILKYLSGGDMETQYHEEIYKLTIVDGLTGAHVRRYLFESLDKEIARARRYARDLGLIMFDIDHFKRVNDTHGHVAGDYVLREIAAIVMKRIRRDQVFARYGGEEFSLVLPETNLAGVRALAESLRLLIEQTRFEFGGEQLRITVSFGVSCLEANHAGALDLVRDADAKLYEAKRAGRNRVVA
jgi:two-component system cell cycle response regulator